MKDYRGYLWSFLSIIASTGVFSLARPWLDKGQASLLFLPVVIVCAVYFGFGPALFAALLSFLCWDYFFLPPIHTLTIHDPRDWLSLGVFLVAAVITARLASRAAEQAMQAKARESEIAVLFQASETLSREIGLDQILAALSDRLRSICRVTNCVVWRTLPLLSNEVNLVPITVSKYQDQTDSISHKLAKAAVENKQVIGFDPSSRALWEKASGLETNQTGVFIPLQTEKEIVGVLEIAPREDGSQFSLLDQRLILTLANHVAVVLAREALSEQAAQTEALREADVLKDSLLSMVSHELRSPLAAIKATATGLSSTLADQNSTQKDDLQVINGGVDRLNAIVNNLLDLSRLEANAWKPQKDWCDVREIVSTALDALPEQDGARVNVEIAENLPLIMVDYTQIALTVMNVLQNAVKYAPAGSDIHLSASSEHENYVEERIGVLIKIKDSGLGIHPGDEEKIFSRFYRSAEHQSSTIRGTGLGLALCQAIVNAHDGKIWASNSSKGGAEFSIFLPVK